MMHTARSIDFVILAGLLSVSCEKKTPPDQPVSMAKQSSAVGLRQGSESEPAASSSSNIPTSSPAWVLKPPAAGSWPAELAPVGMTPTAALADGDGCRKPSLYFAHGWHGERPVRATLSFRQRRLKLELVDIETAAKQVYTGTLNRSVCGKLPGLDELTGLLTMAGSTKTAPLRVSIVEQNSEPDPGYLHIHGSHAAARTQLLELYQVPWERFDAIGKFERMLGAPADIRAGVQLSQGRAVVAHFAHELSDDTPQGRVLQLSVTDTQASGATHAVTTGLVCRSLHCQAAMLGYQVTDRAVLLVPIVAQEYCGGHSCGATSQGALWMLTPAGFRFVADLPEANKAPDLPGTTTESKDTTLHWVDADAEPPNDLLARSLSTLSDAQPDPSLFVFDTSTMAYRRSDSVPPFAHLTDLPRLLRLTPGGVSRAEAR